VTRDLVQLSAATPARCSPSRRRRSTRSLTADAWFGSIPRLIRISITAGRRRHKRQGRGDPLVIGTIARNDDARSAHVALTRCATGLRVYTRLTRDELLDHLTSPASLRPKDDALLFEEIVRRTGGPDTFWAQAVRTALAKDADQLRAEHRSEMRQRTEARGRAFDEILERFKVARAAGVSDTKLATLDRGEKRKLTAAYKEHGLGSFVAWAAQRRMTIEQRADRGRHAERVDRRQAPDRDAARQARTRHR